MSWKPIGQITTYFDSEDELCEKLKRYRGKFYVVYGSKITVFFYDKEELFKVLEKELVDIYVKVADKLEELKKKEIVDSYENEVEIVSTTGIKITNIIEEIMFENEMCTITLATKKTIDSYITIETHSTNKILEETMCWDIS